MKTLFAISLLGILASAVHSQDVRSYQHGVDFVQVAPDTYVVIWASSGFPPTGEDDDGEWSHDVYFSNINSSHPVLRPQMLIEAPTAQEPASAAATKNGNVMVTMEDAWRAENVLRQSYAVYDQRMRPIRPYQSIVLDGGHSGHVAATDERFVVFYSEGWVDGGGVDNLGSGDDIWLKSYDSQGNPEFAQPVAVGNETRDWWPIAAGSTDRVLLLWQRFVAGQNHSRLLFHVYNPERNVWVTDEQVLAAKTAYYTYDVQYLDGLAAFLIVGVNDAGRGFATLVSTQGKIIAQANQLPAFVRESQPAIQTARNGRVRVVYPTGENDLTVLEVSTSQISYIKSIPVAVDWSIAGSDGIFTKDGGLFFLALSSAGVSSTKVSSENLLK